MRQLSPLLFWHAASCSYYALIAQGRALLIDCGTWFPGSRTAPLPDVERLFLTHFHRDQCASAARWHRQGAGVVIPFAQRRFLEVSNLVRTSFDIYRRRHLRRLLSGAPGSRPLLHPKNRTPSPAAEHSPKLEHAPVGLPAGRGVGYGSAQMAR